MSLKGTNQEEQRNKNDQKYRASNYAEQEDLKTIKSHLDHSLDINDIRVSEELILRTLNAVKKAETEQQLDNKQVEKSTHKLIPWNKYIRRTASAVAALLVFGVGISIISGYLSIGQLSKSQDMETAPRSDEKAMTESTEASDNAIEDYAKDENAGMKSDDRPKSSVNYGRKDEPGNSLDGGDGHEGFGAGSNGSPDIVSGVANLPEEDKKADQVFRLGSIFVSSPTFAEYMKITELGTKKEIVLKEKDDINSLYLLLKGYTFTSNSTSPSKQSFMIETKSNEPEGQKYTMVIGDGISVTTQVGTTVSYSTYTIKDYQAMIKKLTSFCKEYNN